MERLWKGKYEFPEHIAAIRSTEPGEGGGAASSDLRAFADCDQEVVGELPDRVRECSPNDHVFETVVFGGVGSRVFDRVNSWEFFKLHFLGEAVDKDMETYTWHDVNE